MGADKFRNSFAPIYQHPYHPWPLLAHLCFQRRDSEIGESCPALVALDVTLI